MNSKFLSLNTKDVLKGLIVAVGTAFGTGLIAILQNGALPTGIQFRAMGISALAAGITYLIKNVLTNSNGDIAKVEQNGNNNQNT